MIDKFLEYLHIEKKYSPHTITSYRKDLMSFLAFYKNTESSNEIETANKKVIRNYVIDLSKNEYSKRSINRKLSTLRSFYLFLMRTKTISSSPMETITSLKFHPQKQTPLSKNEMNHLTEYLKENDVPTLDRLIIEILYQTGIRKAELCNLNYKNFNFSSLELKIDGKGNKQRIIPISQELGQLIETFTLENKNNYTTDSKLLTDNKGQKITEKFVYSITKKYLSLVTKKKKKSPHILRHSFATHILENGAEISNVKELLGHQSLSSTQVYTDANIEQLKKAFNNAHPRGKKNKNN